MFTNQEALAKKMYDDYCDAVGGKAFNGDQLPKSDIFFADETKQKQVNAWRICADTAFNYITYGK